MELHLGTATAIETVLWKFQLSPPISLSVYCFIFYTLHNLSVASLDFSVVCLVFYSSQRFPSKQPLPSSLFTPIIFPVISLLPLLLFLHQLLLASPPCFTSPVLPLFLLTFISLHTVLFICSNPVRHLFSLLSSLIDFSLFFLTFFSLFSCSWDLSIVMYVFFCFIFMLSLVNHTTYRCTCT